MHKYFTLFILMLGLTELAIAQELVTVTHGPFGNNDFTFDFYEGPTTGRIYAIGDGDVEYFEDGEWTDYPGFPITFLGEELRAIATNTDETELWVGTRTDGIIHFNGTEWFNYTPDNSAFPDAWVREIAVDDNGVAWVGTTSGLVRIDGADISVITTDNSALPDNGVYEIQIAANGDLWIANDDYVTRKSGNTYTSWDLSINDLLGFSPKVTELDISNDGIVWVGSLRGVAKYQGGVWSTIPIDVASFINIQSIAVDNDGTVFFGRTNMGLFRYTPITGLILGFGNALPSGQIFGILADSQNRKWTGGAGGNIREINDDELVDFFPIVINQVIDISCNGETDGSILLEAEVAYGSPNVSWEDPNIDFGELNPTELGAGVYTVTVFDDVGLETVVEITITEPDLIEIDATVTNEIQGSTKGAIELTVTGGIGEYTYEWSDSNLTGTSISELDAGVYMVTVTDENDCSVESEITVDLINGVNDYFESELVKVFPTVVQEEVYIENNSSDLRISNVELLDIYGKAHLNRELSDNQFTLDLSSLSNGIYFVQLSFGEQRIVRKIIKQ